MQLLRELRQGSKLCSAKPNIDSFHFRHCAIVSELLWIQQIPVVSTRGLMVGITFDTCNIDSARYGHKKNSHTHGGASCPECDDTGQMLVVVDQDLSSLPFCDVVPIWKKLRKNDDELRPRTHEATDGYLEALSRFFAAMPLNKIHAGHLREYQIARQANQLCGETGEYAPWKRTACASTINHELSVLQQILKHCKLWAPIAPFYFPRHVPDWTPRTIPEEDMDAAIRDGLRRDPDAALAAWVATITNNTSAAGCELRGLRLKHLVLREPTLDKHGIDHTPSEIYVPREATKNDDRPRRIPLNTSAKLAFTKCLQRAHRLGATDPEHYLFPFRRRDHKYDPQRPASRWWIRHNWNKLRKATGLTELCPHDMRHVCITRLYEQGESDQTVQALVGHVGKKMSEYYSHIRMQAKLAAVMRIDSAREVPKKPSGSVRSLPAKMKKESR